MTLTEEEMVAPYMRAIEMKIYEGVQYIHRETWISSCPPLEKCSGIVQPKGRPKKRPSKTRKCLGDPTTGERSGERVGTAHGVGTPGDVGSRGAVGDRATDDPSPSILESMNRAVSSAVSHALPGALREALDLTLPVLLPAIVERAIESVLLGMLSDAVRRAVDLATPGAVEQAVELFRRHRDKAFPDVSCSRDERGYQGADPFIHEEPATQTSNEKTGGEPAGCAGSSDLLYGVHGDKEPTENFGNVGLVTPKEPRLKRLKMKSRFKLSPFVDCLDNDRRKSLKAKFAKWRRQVNAKKRDVGINPKYFVGPEYFVEIEKARTHLSTTHINPYLAVLWRRLESGVRLRPGVSLETLNIQDSSFYGHLVKAWNTLHPPDDECAPVDYAEWDVPTILIEYVEGSLPRWGQPWTTVSNVVLVCNVEQHWVVCLLRIDAWEITLFDSMPSPDRVRQLELLSRLIPYVIAKGGYFDAKSVAPRFDLMPVVSIPKDDELVQGDVHSCGVFACMYIEHMIACDFPQSSSISDVEEYRGKIALEIFAHSDEKPLVGSKKRFLGSKKRFLGKGLWGINGLCGKVSGIKETVSGKRFMGYKRSLGKGFWDPRNGFWEKVYGIPETVSWIPETVSGNTGPFWGKVSRLPYTVCGKRFLGSQIRSLGSQKRFLAVPIHCLWGKVSRIPETVCWIKFQLQAVKHPVFRSLIQGRMAHHAL
ncbi:hypothetical protein CASFOL_018615 [Castilleja foliolosa]|uniref:Ubiquitin-like protease family profile domain-containing protein n=1 Tax=Castilleja foliolosa TaxID=1961234 RepID=A0ABD3D6X1_9LAMI